MTKAELIALLESAWPGGEVEIVDEPTGEGVTEAVESTVDSAAEPTIDTTSVPTTREIEVDETEEVEVQAPDIPDDITVVTANDAIAESFDMRFATFQQRIDELETSVKILLAEVADIKGNVKKVQTGIDVAAKTSPAVADIADLVNRI